MKYLYIFILLFFLVSCNDSEKKNKVENLSDTVNYDKLPDQIAHNIKIDFVDSVFRISILKAKRARVYTEKAKTILDSNIYIEFYSRTSGKRVSTLSADSIIIDDVTRNMTAMGKVVVYADSSKTRLNTSELVWQNSRKKIATKAKISIQSPTRIINGIGFESDIDLKNYVIYQVSGEEYR